MIRPSLDRLTASGLLLLLLAGPALGDELGDARKLYKGGRYDAAMKQAQAWLSQHPGDARWRFLQGLILMKENRQDEAFAVFRRLTEDYPELPEPRNNLAVIYAARGELDLAKSELESAITADPGYAAARENLGDIYVRLAEQAYEKAIALDKSAAGVKEKLDLANRILSVKPQR